MVVSLDALQGCLIFFRAIGQKGRSLVSRIGVLVRGVGSILGFPAVVFQTATGVHVASDLVLDGLACGGIDIFDVGHLLGNTGCRMIIRFELLRFCLLYSKIFQWIVQNAMRKLKIKFVCTAGRALPTKKSHDNDHVDVQNEEREKMKDVK